jgi:hypothetical protein
MMTSNAFDSFLRQTIDRLVLKHYEAGADLSVLNLRKTDVSNVSKFPTRT